MSHQFAFWKTPLELDARMVYLAITDFPSTEPMGLTPLDLALVEAAFVALYPGFVLEASVVDNGNQTMLSNPNGNGALDIAYTAGSVLCTTYHLWEDEWNRIIDAMHEFEMPLYDPQIDERFVLG